jgi:hypothetical protein
MHESAHLLHATVVSPLRAHPEGTHAAIRSEHFVLTYGITGNVCVIKLGSMLMQLMHKCSCVVRTVIDT